MDLEIILGFVATTTGITVSSVGLPIQLLKNYRRKSVEGLSLVFWILAYINGWCWLSYASLKTHPDFFMIIANIPGLFFLTVLFLQFYIYTRNRQQQEL